MRTRSSRGAWALLTWLLRCTGPTCHGWFGTPSFSAPQGMEMSEMLFLGRPEMAVVFFLSPSPHGGKHSFIRFSCRVAGSVVTLEQLFSTDTVSETSSQSSCRNCLAAALWFEVLFCSQECQNYNSQVGAALGHVFVCTSCGSVQIQKDFCSSGPKFYFIKCFQH